MAGPARMSVKPPSPSLPGAAIASTTGFPYGRTAITRAQRGSQSRLI